MHKKSIKLVDATYEHIETIYNWRNEPSIRMVMYSSDSLDWKEHVNWFASILEDDSRFLKVLYYQNKPYGIASFRFVNKESNVGEWGIYIGENSAPKGMGKVLAYQMLNFLFEELNVRKVCAEVLDFNEVSLKFHEKVGFQQDGIMRKHILKNGRYCDIYFFSIFKEEWNEKKLELEKELFYEEKSI